MSLDRIDILQIPRSPAKNITQALEALEQDAWQLHLSKSMRPSQETNIHSSKLFPSRDVPFVYINTLQAELRLHITADIFNSEFL